MLRAITDGQRSAQGMRIGLSRSSSTLTNGTRAAGQQRRPMQVHRVDPRQPTHPAAPRLLERRRRRRARPFAARRRDRARRAGRSRAWSSRRRAGPARAAPADWPGRSRRGRRTRIAGATRPRCSRPCPRRRGDGRASRASSGRRSAKGPNTLSLASRISGGAVRASGAQQLLPGAEIEARIGARVRDRAHATQRRVILVGQALDAGAGDMEDVAALGEMPEIAQHVGRDAA